MRLKLLLFIPSFLFTSFIFSQNSGWFLQQSGTGSELFSVHFEGSLTGWTCGAGGLILKTTNGGNNWAQQTSGINVSLRAVFFISVNTGWAAGDNGVILKTTSGGLIWSVQPSGITSALKCLWFSNDNIGYAAGALGKILKTTNGGNSWYALNSGISTEVNSIMFSDINNGWMSGNSGKILKTTNGGAQWVINIDHGPVSDFYGLYFGNSNRGVAVGRYLDPQNNPFVYFYRTETAGAWWEYIPSQNTKVLRSVAFSDSLNGWAIGDSGIVFGTTNGGINWIEQNSRTINNLNSLYFVSRSIGFAVGKNGTIIKTFHGGYKDTLITNRRDLGVVPLVENVNQLIDATYRVQFRPDTHYNILRSVNNGFSFDTIISNLTFADTGRYFDGLLTKVKKIKYFSGSPSGNYAGNVGVIQDPGLPVDSIQTRFYGWEYFPSQNRYLTASVYKPGGRSYQSKSMSISYPTRNTYVGVRSLLNPEDLRAVKIVFTGYGNGQRAYRYLASATGNGNPYSYQDMREVPFKVYEIDFTDGTNQPRQVNCAFLEWPDGAPDNKWEPTADSLGGKEILYIFSSNYSPAPDSFYTSKNLFLGMLQMDVMYIWAPKRISANSNFQVNDEFYIYPYTVTRPEIAPGYPLYYEFKTQSIIGIEPISTTIPQEFGIKQNYPNPFNPVTKIKFDLPASQKVTIRVYDVLGKELQLILNEKLNAGEYEIEWNAARFSSGVYFCKIESESFNGVIKMVLIK